MDDVTLNLKGSGPLDVGFARQIFEIIEVCGGKDSVKILSMTKDADDWTIKIQGPEGVLGALERLFLQLGAPSLPWPPS